jgi:serine/threonine protein kinase
VSSSWVSPPGPPTPDQPSETLAGFSNWRRIGRGGDAVVYRATQDALDRDVAIKVLTLDDEESVRRFTREVQLMVSLGRQHPNIAKVLQIGTSSLGRPCIVMDYYELGSLDQRLGRTGPLGSDEVIVVGTVIADALAFAHSRGVLHRDVKPQNILVLPTSYVLADFGIARLIDSAHTASSDRFSHRHASPQVLDGCPPSGSDDIFSLGATMFHLLDGRPPFTTPCAGPEPALAYIERVRTAEPRQLTRTDVPPALAALIRRCLRKHPTERFGSADELRDELAAMRAGRFGVSSPPSAPPTTADLPVPDRTYPTWGGVRGAVHRTADLTAMRLRDTHDRMLRFPGSPEESSLPDLSPAYAAADTPRKSTLSPLSVALAGVALGVVIMMLWALVLRPETSPSAIPVTTPTPVTPTPTGKATPEELTNQDLAPRNLHAEFAGDRIRVSWEDPIDTPRRFLIGIAPDRDKETILVEQALFDATSAEIPVEPSWPQVCVVVIGVRDSETGFEQKCLSR